MILSPHFSVMITSDLRDSDISMKNAASLKMISLGVNDKNVLVAMEKIFV